MILCFPRTFCLFAVCHAHAPRPPKRRFVSELLPSPGSAWMFWHPQPSFIPSRGLLWEPASEAARCCYCFLKCGVYFILPLESLQRHSSRNFSEAEMTLFLLRLRILGLVKEIFPSLPTQTIHFSGVLFP